MVRWLTQRPLRRTNSELSDWEINQVAPPALRLARFSCFGRAPAFHGRSSFWSTLLKRCLSVDEVKGQSFSPAAKFPKPSWTTRIKSGCSIFPTWCRAARNRVFGSTMRSKRWLTEWLTSAGKIRSLLKAMTTSPIRSSAPQANAKQAASLVHPQTKQVLITASKTWWGMAAWCSVGSRAPHIKAKSQAAPIDLRSIGRLVVTPFRVSAYL